MSEELEKLEERIKILEAKVAELDSRTLGMIRLGPLPESSMQSEVERVMRQLECKEKP